MHLDLQTIKPAVSVHWSAGVLSTFFFPRRSSEHAEDQSCRVDSVAGDVGRGELSRGFVSCETALAAVAGGSDVGDPRPLYPLSTGSCMNHSVKPSREAFFPFPLKGRGVVYNCP